MGEKGSGGKAQDCEGGGGERGDGVVRGAGDQAMGEGGGSPARKNLPITQ